MKAYVLISLIVLIISLVGYFINLAESDYLRLKPKRMIKKSRKRSDKKKKCIK
tara:strand:+ start:129 stop:287 length:159 start_codon:yes stop_codon:yes gene_type:complete